MTEQVYVTREKIEALRTKASKEIELAVGQSKIVLVDLERVRPLPKVSKKDNKPYVNYICEVVEYAAENEEIEREIEVTEFQLGKFAEMLGTESRGTVKITGEKNGEFVRRKYEKI